MDTLVARKNYKCSILYITGLLYTTLGDGQACHPINSQGWLRRGRLMYGKSGLRQRYLQGLSPWMEVNFPEYGFCRGCGPKPGVWVGNFHRPSLCEKELPMLAVPVTFREASGRFPFWNALICVRKQPPGSHRQG